MANNQKSNVVTKMMKNRRTILPVSYMMQIIIRSNKMEDKYHRIFALVSRQVRLQLFQKYILQSQQHQQELINSVRLSQTSGFPRFNVWRLLLGILPFASDWNLKLEHLKQSRGRWTALKQQARTGVKQDQSPTKQSSPVSKNPLMKVNPLMKGPQKSQKKQQTDSFLLQQIKKDVDRTYQEMQFFQDPHILKLLTSVLFVWCKTNPEVSYKQGINQLLASVVYVYFQEAVPADFPPSNDLEANYLALNTTAHAQPDIFAVFERIMEVQKEMFKENLDSGVKGLVNPNSKNNSPILQRIVHLMDHRLKAMDLQLFRIIKLQDVKTKTFLLRWIRCLHTRQFGLTASLPIWDSILLQAHESPLSRHKHQFEFVDAMCIAMFIYLRTIVVTRETSNEILQTYQKYPQLNGQYLVELITLAWSVLDELRNQAASSNEAEQPHITQTIQPKDTFANTFRQQEIEEKKKQAEEKQKQIAKETEEIEKESNALFLKKDSPKNKQDTLFQKTKPPKEKEEKPANLNKTIFLPADDLAKAIQYLKKSIIYNEQPQSKTLAKQVLLKLQQKLPQP